MIENSFGLVAAVLVVVAIVESAGSDIMIGSAIRIVTRKEPCVLVHFRFRCHQEEVTMLTHGRRAPPYASRSY